MKTSQADDVGTDPDVGSSSQSLRRSAEPNSLSLAKLSNIANEVLDMYLICFKFEHNRVRHRSGSTQLAEGRGQTDPAAHDRGPDSRRRAGDSTTEPDSTVFGPDVGAISKSDMHSDSLEIPRDGPRTG